MPEISKPVSVCMLVHQDYYMDARVMQYADYLISNGFNVDVICCRLVNPAPANAQDKVKVYPISIKHDQGSVIGMMLEYLAALFFYTLRLTQLFLVHRYAIIHIHNMPDFLVFAAIIPKLLGAKVILDIHDPMPEFYLSKFAGKLKTIVLLMRTEEYLSSAFVDAVITANPIFKDNLIQRGIDREKITVIANYPDPKVFSREKYTHKSAIKNEHFRIIYPGTLASRYGLDIPIRALVQLSQEIPNIRLILIGPRTPYVDELEHLAEELRVQAWLEIRPAIPIDKVPGEMAQADVGIYTARPDSHMDIAISGKILEYAIMGIPVVTSRLSIAERLFPQEAEAVLFFPPGDVDAFAARILELYRQPELRRRLVEKMDAVFTKNHSWKKEEDRYIHLLHKLLA